MMPNEFSSVAVGLAVQRLACLIRIDLALMLTRCETKIEGPIDCRLGANCCRSGKLNGSDAASFAITDEVLHVRIAGTGTGF
jgi:hypothetical protein